MNLAVVVTVTAPGANSNTYSIWNTYTAGLTRNFFALNNVARCIVDIAHSADFTFKWYKSADGTTWNQLDDLAITFASGETSTLDMLVDMLLNSYFKIEVVNGGSAQDPWRVNVNLITDRSPGS
jgi:hypothetical protein